MNKLTKTPLEEAKRLADYLETTMVTDTNLNTYVGSLFKLESLIRKIKRLHDKQ